MSRALAYSRKQEHKGELLEVLKRLILIDAIDHEAARGIVQKVIADRGTHTLSPRQFAVFETHVLKLFFENKFCEDFDCSVPLSIGEAIEAKNDVEFDKLLCSECRYKEMRRREFMRNS